MKIIASQLLVVGSHAKHLDKFASALVWLLITIKTNAHKTRAVDQVHTTSVTFFKEKRIGKKNRRI